MALMEPTRLVSLYPQTNHTFDARVYGTLSNFALSTLENYDSAYIFLASYFFCRLTPAAMHVMQVQITTVSTPCAIK